jgi:hypothetical protein
MILRVRQRFQTPNSVNMGSQQRICRRFVLTLSAYWEEKLRHQSGFSPVASGSRIFWVPWARFVMWCEG